MGLGNVRLWIVHSLLPALITYHFSLFVKKVRSSSTDVSLAFVLRRVLLKVSKNFPIEHFIVDGKWNSGNI